MGFILSVLYVSLVYLSIGDILPSLATYRVNLVVVAVAILATIPSILSRQDYFTLPELHLMFGFIGAIFLSLLMVGWFGGVVLAAQKVMPATMAFFLFAANCTSPFRVRVTMYVIICLAIYLIFRGQAAYWVGTLPSPWLMEQGYWELPNMQGRHLVLIRIRAMGMLQDPNDFAQFIVMTIPMLWLSWRKHAWVSNFFLVLLPVCWMFYGMFLSRSRGSLVGLLVILAIIFYRKYGKIASALGPAILAFGLLAVGFSGGRALSLAGGRDRILLWSDGLGMLLKSPLWGVSWGAYTDYSAQTAHNSFVLCFAELGLIGLFFYVALVIVTGRRLQFLSSSPQVTEDLRRTANVLKYVFYGFIASSWFLSRTYEVTLFLILGLAAALELCHRENLIFAGKPRQEDPPFVKPTLVAMASIVVAVYLSIKISN